ncbi:MAG TPA: prepilin-type N-terminal cleavage/methylation domain-containing protein [Kofleriaceae bacterium]|nr:prepilin-type N-terminal cleavage/methylation domain-containing protein [Kofleriaceae bacterium]
MSLATVLVSVRRRRQLARQAERGMTLLEIMIVIAILGLLIALVVPRVMGAFGESKTKIAKIAVDKIANEDYPRWAMGNTDKGCPDSLVEVATYVEKTEADMKDPWGTPYKFFCGAGNLPAGVKSGIAVMSFGEDKAEGTADDIKSWEKLK